jgi:hypothetical protein
MQTRAPAAARAAPPSRATGIQARAALSGTASSRALLRRASAPAAAPPSPTSGRRSMAAVGVPTTRTAGGDGSRRAVSVARRAPRPSSSSSGAPRR